MMSRAGIAKEELRIVNGREMERQSESKGKERQEAVKRKRKVESRTDKGALTIEASIAYPIFLMVIVTILYLMRIVYTYGLIQHAVSQTAKELSMYTYIYQVAGLNDLRGDIDSSTAERTEQFNSDVDEVVALYETFSSGDFSGSYEGTTNPADILKNIGSVLLGEGSRELNSQFFQSVVKPLMEGYIGADANGNSANERLKALRVIGGFNGLDFSSSRFFEDGATVDLVVCYTIDPLFPIDIMPEINLANRAMVRGIKGSSVFVNDSSDENESEEKEEQEKTSVWDEPNAAKRGELIQEQQGVRNLPDTFPAFSAFDVSTGTATAEMSIDLRGDSYQSTKGIVSTIRGECNKIINYRTSTRDNVTVKAEDIQKTVLIIYIPSSTESRVIDRSAYDQAVAQVREAYPDIQIVTKEID